MKRILLFLTVMILAVSVMTSCDMLYQIIPDYVIGGESPDKEIDKPDIGDEKPDADNENPDIGDEKPDTDNEMPDHLYNDFTYEDKALMIETVGEVIPFIPNDYYYLSDYYTDYDDGSAEEGVIFQTLGNTEAEFSTYLEKFSKYAFDGNETDTTGDEWYYYTTDNGYFIDICFYVLDGESFVDVYIYVMYENADGGEENPDTGDTNPDGHPYTDFTDEEKSLLYQVVGELVPFVDSDEYFLEEYTYEYDDCYEWGVNFYTFGNTEEEFEAYKSLFSSYLYDGSEYDEYGDAWYYYTSAAGNYIDLSFYLGDSEYVIDLYIYNYYDYDDGGDEGEGGNTDAPENLITNEGAGLPVGTNGVYHIDFTDATNVKDVTDQGYYADGCPTVGSPKVLVIPVDFTDINGRLNGFSIDNIERAFIGGEGETDYYSVHDYYYISSYGRLDLDITVIDEWFIPEFNSSHYKNATYDYFDTTVAIGDQLIMDEALAYLSEFMDLSEFDSDGNAIIDAVVLITTLEIDDESDFNWAYRYWNIYTDEDGYYYEYDGVSANDYMWASYSFMHESYDEEGYAYYTDTSVMNTFTYIHEFGHILGADDYYDTSEFEFHPLEGCDIMDGMNGDHNPYTKFNLGWITSSRLVTAADSVTLTLNSFASTGDTLIIGNNWDWELGAYQEYYVIMYYTSEGLNDGSGGYFARDGIVVYHVNSSLFYEDYDGERIYDVYYSNTSDYEIASSNALIEFVKSTEGNFTYVEGDMLGNITDDQGNTLVFTFTVDSIDEDTATITFTRK